MSEPILTGLTDQQADGLACVWCGADYLTVATPHSPVGRSATDSQVFACAVWEDGSEGTCTALVAAFRMFEREFGIRSIAELARMRDQSSSR